MLFRRRPLAARPGRRRRREPRVRRPAASPQTPNPSRKEDSCFDDSSFWPASRWSRALWPLPRSPLHVKVRVEGKTTTIFGSAQPTLTTGTNALSRARCGEHRGRVLLPRAVDLVRPVRRPDRAATPAPVRAAGASRSTASRRRSEPTRRAEGRRHGALVLVDVQRARRVADLALAQARGAQLLPVVSQNDQGVSTPAAGARSARRRAEREDEGRSTAASASITASSARRRRTPCARTRCR